MESSHQLPRYALVVPLSRALEIRIEDLFLGLPGTSKPIMGFHITVVGPFTWTNGPDEALLAKIAEICATWPPFTVRLRGLSAFRSPNDNAVYIPVEKDAQLQELHRVLQMTLGPAISLQRELPQEGYQPHVTLGLGLTDSELERVMADAQGRKLDACLLVDEIQLAEEQPGAPWRRIRAFALNKAKPQQDAEVRLYEG